MKKILLTLMLITASLKAEKMLSAYEKALSQAQSIIENQNTYSPTSNNKVSEIMETLQEYANILDKTINFLSSQSQILESNNNLTIVSERYEGTSTAVTTVTFEDGRNSSNKIVAALSESMHYFIDKKNHALLLRQQLAPLLFKNPSSDSNDVRFIQSTRQKPSMWTKVADELNQLATDFYN